MLRRFGLAAAWAAAALPALAVTRGVDITAPATVRAGAAVTVSATARTDAAGENVGFFHAEFSLDGGRTWTGFCYEQNVAPPVTRDVHLTAGPAGSAIVIRVRIAFRGGVAGDVDYRGAAIKWKDSWEKWESPPTKVVRIAVEK